MTLSADSNRIASRPERRATQLSKLVAVAFAVAAVLLIALGGLATSAQTPATTPSAIPAATSGPQTSPAPSTNPSSPAPSSPSSPAPSASVAPSPGASQPPCPIPVTTPAPAASVDPNATPVPGASPTPAPTASPVHPLCPAVMNSPTDILAVLFNPIFQTMFLLLAVFYSIFGDIGIAIILLTLLIKTILIPLFRAQIVSQRRMQMLQPEIRAIQQKFKGNRAKVSEETMRLYKERGVSVGSGCLPAFLQLFLLLPIYSVINTGLAAPDISSAMQFLSVPLDIVKCQAPGTLQPCINPAVAWLGGMDAHIPEILFKLPVIGFGVSGLALIAAALQLIQTRMMTPSTTDPQQKAQQRIFLVLPLFSIIYGSFLPAGLFLYWIVFTTYSIVQQYLIVGWGSLFPLFGWTPRFAQDHTPRFPVPPPVARAVGTSGDSRRNEEPNRSPTDRAAGTIKPGRQRGRTSRRGRRR